MATQNPFATTKPKAPEVQENVAPKALKKTPSGDKDPESKDKNPRKAPNKASTLDQKKFVISNYATMSRGELADATGLTGQQVYNIVREVRVQMTAMAVEARKSGDEAKAVAIENKIAEKLPKKVVGGKSGGGRKKADLNSIIDDLLA